MQPVQSSGGPVVRAHYTVWRTVGEAALVIVVGLLTWVAHDKSWIMTALTALLVIYAYRSWAAARDMAIRTSQNATNQLAEMQRAAKAAEESAAAAATSARAATASHRAYVFLDTTLTRKENPAFGWQFDSPFKLRLSNFGQTPAEVGRLAFAFRYFPPGLLEDLPDPSSIGVDDVQQLEGVFLAHGPLGPRLARLQATSSDIDRARGGEGVIAIVGTLRYRDMFAGHHELGFALRLVPIPAGVIARAPRVFDWVGNPRLNYSRTL